MERSSKQYADDHNGSVISSEELVGEEEKEQLLGSSSLFLRRKTSRIPPFCYLIALLILVANAILLSILLQVVLSRTPEAKVQKSWLPPEGMWYLPRYFIPSHHLLRRNTYAKEPSSQCRKLNSSNSTMSMEHPPPTKSPKLGTP